MRRAYLGLGGQVRPVSRRVQRYFELPTETVVEAVSVEPTGPAYRGGLRAGDWIIALDAQAIGSVDDIHRLLNGKQAGSLMKLTAVRGQQRLEIIVIAGDV